MQGKSLGNLKLVKTDYEQLLMICFDCIFICTNDLKFI